MLVDFYNHLKSAKLPVSITEYLALMEALSAGVAEYSIDNFYYLARVILVKDEKHLDRFDKVFGDYFNGRSSAFEDILGEVPEEWLRKQLELMLSEEEKQQVESLGGWDELMDTLRKLLEEQEKRHQGGNKWIGTGGRSPFGAYGYNPEGVRIGQKTNRNNRAVKVWDKRSFENLDDDVQLGTRNLKVALTNYENLREKERGKNLILMTPYAVQHEMLVGSILRWCRSGTMP